jgi:hypothetical protein
MRHFFNLWQRIVSKRQSDHALQLSLQKLCHVRRRFISNADSPIEQRNILSSQTHAPSKAPGVCDTAIAMRGSYTSILSRLDKLWANSDSASEMEALYMKSSFSSKQFWPISTLSSFKRPKKPWKNPSRNKDSQAKSRASKQPPAPPSHDHHATCHSLSLTQLATRMLTTLNPSKKSHFHILENFLCAFFNHPGSPFFLTIFTEPQPPQEQETFAGLLPPKVCRACRPSTQRPRREQSN